MSRYRSHLLALFGGLLLVALSLSSAFGAHPDSTGASDKTNHGNQVSDFVHGLLFGEANADEEQDANEDEDAEDAEDADDADEEAVDEEVVDEEAVDEEAVDEEAVDEEAVDEEVVAGQPDNHGACVSEVAQSDEVGDPNGNHGGAVSFAARVTCREGAGGEAASTEATTNGHGKSAAAHERARGRHH